jgi:hypothetical protein
MELVAPMSPYEAQVRATAKAAGRQDQWPYPWEFRAEDGRGYCVRGSVAAPAFGAVNQVLIAEYEVPAGFIGVLRHLWCQYVGTGYVEGSGNVVFTVDINTRLGVTTEGYLLPYFGTIAGQLGSNVTPFPLDGGWMLDEGDVVRLKGYTVGTVSVGAPNYVLGGLMGWIWPTAQQGVRVNR